MRKGDSPRHSSLAKAALLTLSYTLLYSVRQEV